MADASDTDVVQEVSKILASSDVVVERCEIGTRIRGFKVASLEMFITRNYDRCKADSNDYRLEEPEVEADCRWNLSRVDDLKELVPAIVKSANLKHFSWFQIPDYPDLIESLLQGLCANHSIVKASFTMTDFVPDLIDKFVVMLCHNTSLKEFILETKHRKHEHDLPMSGFGKALGMNHTLQTLHFRSWGVELDLEELVQPLIMNENGNQANSTLTTLVISNVGFISISFIPASIARMLRRNSSIKHLTLQKCLETESDARELIQSLADNHSLETLDLKGCDGVKGTVFHAIMDVLLMNFTLKEIDLEHTPLRRKGKHVVINKQLEKNVAAKELHLMELEMAKPTSARVIFCGSPYAGMSPISIGPITQLHQFVFHLKLDAFDRSISSHGN
jgi:hypothetical protein